MFSGTHPMPRAVPSILGGNSSSCDLVSQLSVTPERKRGYCKLTRKGDGEYRRLISNAAIAVGRSGFKPYLERARCRGMQEAMGYQDVYRAFTA